MARPPALTSNGLQHKQEATKLEVKNGVQKVPNEGNKSKNGSYNNLVRNIWLVTYCSATIRLMA